VNWNDTVLHNLTEQTNSSSIRGAMKGLNNIKEQTEVPYRIMASLRIVVMKRVATER